MVVDASVWVSALVPVDVHHAASRRWLEARLQEGAPLIAPVILLAEVGGAIARRTGDAALGRQAAGMLLAFPTLRLTPVDDRLGGEAALLAARLRLRGGGCGVCGHRRPAGGAPGDLGRGATGAGRVGGTGAGP